MDNGASSYRRFLDGDESAFDSIMEEYFPGLIFFIDGYLHDIHAAEDVAMDAFADLIVHRTRYNFKVTLKTYLFMIARSRALDHLRRRKKGNIMPLSVADDLPDDGTTPEDFVLRDEKHRRVNHAIAKLGEDMRVAVHLVYFEEMSYEEAAKVMKKKKKQVDNLLYRAKKELRAILGEDGEWLV